MTPILLRHGTVVTAADTYAADVLIADGKIASFGTALSPEGVMVIEATGYYVLPGGIDVHTHLAMPLGDLISADDFASGTVAAACGGTTTILDYAAYKPGASMEQGLDTWFQKAEGRAVIDYGFHMTVSDYTDRTYWDMERMIARGVTSFKVFTAYPDRLMLDDAAIFKVLKHAHALGGLVCTHAENGHIIDVLIQDALDAGHTAPKYHALTRPPQGEGEAVQRLLTLAELAGSPLYVVHISCCDAIHPIVEAKHRGVPVYAETCPQYLLLTADCYDLPEFEGAKYVMSPPLRDASHQACLWEAIQNGTITVIGTDHCPFQFQGEKERGRHDFTQIPNGAPGIETRLSLLYTGGVCTGRISLNRFVDLMSTAPAKLFGLYPQKGTIAPGSDADLLLVHPTKETLISAITHHSRVDYSLYEGRRVKGVPEMVFSRGELIVEQGNFIGKPGRGRFVQRRPYSRMPGT
ncbi:dihydropyrimidinase [candidate division KSB3 bacterium]|uniref:Dihydropyrimidinase n=1 Tax=candidate division KSB3 bacterium TaxID=2044937 RepID=A0A9D5JVY1_9BACT|nr:dihydropyrimidinase [candidate division KSB3 bacterium]MBD3324936.1 dihydropyrimidinase [candidate division KSB3 bacterium]